MSSDAYTKARNGHRAPFKRQRPSHVGTWSVEVASQAPRECTISFEDTWLPGPPLPSLPKLVFFFFFYFSFFFSCIIHILHYKNKNKDCQEHYDTYKSTHPPQDIETRTQAFQWISGLHVSFFVHPTPLLDFFTSHRKQERRQQKARKDHVYSGTVLRKALRREG